MSAVEKVTVTVHKGFASAGIPGVARMALVIEEREVIVDSASRAEQEEE